MRFLLGLFLGLVIGFGLAAFRSRTADRPSYLTAQDTALADERGSQLALIPKGRPVLALAANSFEPDLGWWGCVPVLYSDGFKARDMLLPTTPWSPVSGPVISAHSLGDLPKSRAQQEPGTQ
jgi:hypothetical protein